jgi:hypothetical protein
MPFFFLCSDGGHVLLAFDDDFLPLFVFLPSFLIQDE